jgi:membrane protease subunit (stomatin/prohibitin family)
MSKENLIAYLKNFNNIDISSLQIVNNFQKDGFYEVQVSIVGNIFTFKLWEKDHVIADISFVDTV